MLNKYFLLLVGLVAAIYVPTTNAYGVCSCSCCSGAGCEPRFQGTVDVPSCDELNCIKACKEKFSLECNDPSTSEVEAPCQEIDTTTVSTTQTSTIVSSSTLTSTVTTSAANITVTITTTVTTLPNTTSSESSTTTATGTTGSSTSSAQTSPATTTEPSSSAFILRESAPLIALLITSILVITKLIL